MNNDEKLQPHTQRFYQRSLSAPAWSSQLSSRRGAESDVTFNVGRKPEVWRISAHKEILARSSPVFHAMFRGPCACLAANNDAWRENCNIDITDIDGRGFENLMSFLYGEKVELRSIATALATSDAAHKYMNSDLIEICVHYISTRMNASNILHIYQHALFYNEDSKQFSENLQQDLYGSLVEKCLQYIDKAASSILASEDFEDLDRQAVCQIVSRDTLEVIYESEILDALCRWARCQCRRQQLDLTPENQRTILGDLFWQVRFLAMSAEEFLMGPVTCGLFTCEEQIALIGCLYDRRRRADLPEPLLEHLPRLTARRTSSKAPPIKRDSGTSTNNQEPKKFSKKKVLNRRPKVYGTAIAQKLFLCLAYIFD